MVCQPPPGPRLRTKTPGLLSPFDRERPIGSTPLVAKPARSVAFVILLALGACSSAPEGTGATTPSPTATVGSSPTPAVQDIMEIEHFAPLEPGTYSIDPDLDPSTPLQVIYEIGAEGWSMWIGAAKFVRDGHVGVSITTVSNLVSHGCRDHAWADPPVGSSVDDLANALADLAPFRVTLPPEDVSLYGYRGKHLALIVPDLKACARLLQIQGMEHSELAAHDKIMDWIRLRLQQHAERNSGATRSIRRAVLLPSSPSLDEGEVTDKGSINQRAVLRCRAELIAALYAEPPPAIVITV